LRCHDDGEASDFGFGKYVPQVSDEVQMHIIVQAVNRNVRGLPESAGGSEAARQRVRRRVAATGAQCTAPDGAQTWRAILDQGKRKADELNWCQRLL